MDGMFGCNFCHSSTFSLPPNLHIHGGIFTFANALLPCEIFTFNPQQVQLVCARHRQSTDVGAFGRLTGVGALGGLGERLGGLGERPGWYSSGGARTVVKTPGLSLFALEVRCKTLNHRSHSTWLGTMPSETSCKCTQLGDVTGAISCKVPRKRTKKKRLHVLRSTDTCV